MLVTVSNYVFNKYGNGNGKDETMKKYINVLQRANSNKQASCRFNKKKEEIEWLFG